MDIIEIAKECGALGFNTLEFTRAGLQQFAQRIEAPHLQRIAELEQELHYAKQAARVEADMYDQARAAMKQLREALGKIILWIDGDTRAINRDVGIGNCDYNDIYESLDKLEKIAADALEASA